MDLVKVPYSSGTMTLAPPGRGAVEEAHQAAKVPWMLSTTKRRGGFASPFYVLYRFRYPKGKLQLSQRDPNKTFPSLPQVFMSLDV